MFPNLEAAYIKEKQETNTSEKCFKKLGRFGNKDIKSSILYILSV
jgi:hypothetical protein